MSALGDTGESCTATVIGGVSILAVAGTDTRFERFKVQDRIASGRVVRTDTGADVDERVLVSVRSEDEEGRPLESAVEARAVGGEFRLQLAEAGRGTRVQAHYLGEHPYTPCDSEEIEA